jgi:hypothetical protein
MPRNVARWPDGRLGVFSSIVDAYVFWGSQAEVEDWLLARLGAEDAAAKLARGLADEPLWNSWTLPTDGLRRFYCNLQSMCLNRSLADFEALIFEMRWSPAVHGTARAAYRLVQLEVERD